MYSTQFVFPYEGLSDLSTLSDNAPGIRAGFDSGSENNIVDCINYGSASHFVATSMMSYDWLSSVYKSAVVGGSIITGCLLGMAVAAWIEPRHGDLAHRTEDPRVAERRKIREYQERYTEELSRLPDKELTNDELEEISKETVTENTPHGIVTMMYNPQAECFWYYTDARNIPYRTLDAVARYFAVSTEAKAICVNYKEEIAAAREAVKKVMNSDDKPDRKEKDDKESSNNGAKAPARSVFATFKTNDTKSSMKKQRNGGNYPIIVKESNRFCYKGKLNDVPTFDESNSESETDVVDIKNMSFADYKAGQKV